MIDDGAIGIEHLELVIVGDYYLRDSKLAFNILLNKISSILLGDFGERLCLNPLGEIIFYNVA